MAHVGQQPLRLLQWKSQRSSKSFVQMVRQLLRGPIHIHKRSGLRLAPLATFLRNRSWG